MTSNSRKYKTANKIAELSQHRLLQHFQYPYQHLPHRFHVRSPHLDLNTNLHHPSSSPFEGDFAPFRESITV